MLHERCKPALHRGRYGGWTRELSKLLHHAQDGVPARSLRDAPILHIAQEPNQAPDLKARPAILRAPHQLTAKCLDVKGCRHRRVPRGAEKQRHGRQARALITNQRGIP